MISNHMSLVMEMKLIQVSNMAITLIWSQQWMQRQIHDLGMRPCLSLYFTLYFYLLLS